MEMLSPEIVKEIVSDLECGLRVYLHRKTLERLSVPTEELMAFDDGTVAEELKRVQRQKKQFILFEPMSSRDAFQMMEAFMETVPPGRIRGQLADALEQRKPFARFREVVDNAGSLRERWFEFRREQYTEYVKEHWTNTSK